MKTTLPAPSPNLRGFASVGTSIDGYKGTSLEEGVSTGKAALTECFVSTDKVALAKGGSTGKAASSKKNGVIASKAQTNSDEIPRNGLDRNRDRCVQCGHCLSLCSNQVFSRDENWELILESSLCRACGLCVEACPLGALAIRNE
jgi:Pyruvate/2-oxoacid:ferredoxin oxidoreductase delta subunit